MEFVDETIVDPTIRYNVLNDENAYKNVDFKQAAKNAGTAAGIGMAVSTFNLMRAEMRGSVSEVEDAAILETVDDVGLASEERLLVDINEAELAAGETGKIVEVADEAGAIEEVGETAIAQPNGIESNLNKTNYGKSSENLNWDTIVSKKGENRIDHINRHAVPNMNRETHGVFNGNPVDMVNEAWEQRFLAEPISDGMGGTIYNIQYKNAGYESGYINTGATMDYMTIITMENSNDLIAAFPSFGNYHK